MLAQALAGGWGPHRPAAARLQGVGLSHGAGMVSRPTAHEP